jgi:hypothetical protein
MHRYSDLPAELEFEDPERALLLMLFLAEEQGDSCQEQGDSCHLTGNCTHSAAAPSRGDASLTGP